MKSSILRYEFLITAERKRMMEMWVNLFNVPATKFSKFHENLTTPTTEKRDRITAQ